VENGSLSQAQKPKLAYPMSPMAPMRAKGALSQNMIDNDMAELVDFVISDNAQLQPSNGYGLGNGYGYDAFVDNRIYHTNQPIQHTQNTQRWQ